VPVLYHETIIIITAAAVKAIEKRKRRITEVSLIVLVYT
jgi:hypothetical protein